MLVDAGVKHMKSMRENYRSIGESNPLKTKIVILFCVLFGVAALAIMAITNDWMVFSAFSEYLELLKALSLFCLAPPLLFVSFVGYKAKVFIGAGRTTPTRLNEKPIQFYILIVMWPVLAVCSIWGAWYWLSKYINA